MVDDREGAIAPLPSDNGDDRRTAARPAGPVPPGRVLDLDLIGADCPWFSPQLQSLAHQAMKRRGLKDRECDVLLLALADEKDLEIPRRLGISYKTVRGYIDSAYQTLNVHNRVQMAGTVYGEVVRMMLTGERTDCQKKGSRAEREPSHAKH